MRLGAKRPPSTTGRSACTTARTRPSWIGIGPRADSAGAPERRASGAAETLPALLRLLSTMSLPTQHHGGKRRYVEIERVRSSVRAHGYRLDAAEIAPAGSAIFARVAVEHLAPQAALWNAHQKIVAGHRSEVGHHQHRWAVRALAHESEDAHRRIPGIDPLESLVGEINLVKRAFTAINAVQVAHPLLHAGVFRQSSDPPFEFALVGPFASLREFAAHEQEFLARMSPHVAIQRTQIGKHLPVVAGHLADQRAFAVDHFVMRERQDEVLVERINQ